MIHEHSSTRPLDGVRIEHYISDRIMSIGTAVIGFATVIVEGFNDLKSSDTREVHIPQFLLRQ